MREKRGGRRGWGGRKNMRKDEVDWAVDGKREALCLDLFYQLMANHHQVVCDGLTDVKQGVKK